MTKQTDVQLASIDENKTLSQQQQPEINAPIASSSTPPQLKLPRSVLFDLGSRENYLKIGVPLYEASMNCDWKAAKGIIDEYKEMELVRCSISENGETPLHIAASAKGPKHAEEFVKNLVGLMTNDDLELQNKNHNTAFFLAAAAGNIKMVKIMMERNMALLTIAGSAGMMPLYTAAMFGNEDVVKYLYNNSNQLRDGGWTTKYRGRLLQKCVENDMFDVALDIVKTYPQLGSRDVLFNLAQRPDALSETKSNVIKRSLCSVFTLTGLRVGGFEKESEALQLLRIIWGHISKRPTTEIDDILRGPSDSENLVQALPLQKLIFKHLDKLTVETESIMGGPPNINKLDKALQLQKLISEHLVNIQVETENHINQDNKHYSRKRGQTLQLRKDISEHIVNIRDEFQNINVQVSENEDQASNLQNLILKHITNVRALSGFNRKQYSSRLLFVAAKMGNTVFVVELIRQYHDLIWKVNDDSQTIFHVAVKYRHEGIYNVLREIGSMKDLITPLRDADGNNMAHLAGKGTTKERLADVSGAALQMQRELLWFKEVWNMIPPSYRERKNDDGLTPRELFSEEHKELIREGEKWMKDTASQCMVVAALIATIVFAAAFTVPGGYNQSHGIPIFYQKSTFIVFVVADAMSLFLSSTSILTFLSILTSRYAERDFVESLPTKLMLGISTLFLSITAMMITFSVSFFILYHKEMKWIPIFISVFALLPVILYVVLQYHVLADVIRSTYGSKYLFKPGKQVLYYVNPRV